VRAMASPYGKILVDGSGYTLYVLRSPAGKPEVCGAKCQAAGWVPFLLSSNATRISTGRGVDGHLGTVLVDGGRRRQLTDNGFPLYGFTRDSVPTEYRGEGLPAAGAEKGTWEVVSATATTPATTPVLEPTKPKKSVKPRRSGSS
jgi:predicted lipoprotein with Yx(FWY)xxD motif